MTQELMVPFAGAPRLGRAGRALRWICTNNPFYVLSAGLFLTGLWISFNNDDSEETWALMSWLAGYTLLLAGAAYVLVRFAKVWDDARTVLLLVVLMFLATSVTFDEVLVQTPRRGVACYLMGLAFAIAVSEWLLRGIGLALPPLFRAPYYLILALFFLYPFALLRGLHEQHSEIHMWILFGFTSVAGLVFLSLVPAARRGADYVRDNGSPWAWPLYPWTLFGMLALAVPARSYLLSYSMHLPEGDTLGELIVGPYFLVPFGFAVCFLLLEIGLEAKSQGLLWTALLLPLGLVAAALFGHRSETLYQEFLSIFVRRLGATPGFLTLCLAVAYYAYAALRGTPFATTALTAALAALTFVSPATLEWNQVVAPQPIPLMALAVIQMMLAFWQRDARHWLAAALMAALAVSVLESIGPVSVRALLAFHFMVAAIFAIGAAFDDRLSRWLRTVAAALLASSCLVSLTMRFHLPWDLPAWGSDVYALTMTVWLLGYGLLLGHLPARAMAGVVFVCWLGSAGWLGYRMLRLVLIGLDYIAGSLALFATAVVISFGKAGLLARWHRRRREQTP